MSQMACLCGGTIRNNLVPCPTEDWVLRDEDAEAYYDAACRDITVFFAAVHAGRREGWIAEFLSPQYPAEVGDERIVNDILCCHQRLLLLSLAECSRCGRLWMQREPEVNSYRSYAPDEPGYAEVLASEALRHAEPGTEPPERDRRTSRWEP